MTPDKLWKEYRSEQMKNEELRVKIDALTERTESAETERNAAITRMEAAEAIMAKMKTKIATWLVHGERGMSSEAMAFCLLGAPLKNGSFPYDPSDLNRCLKLLADVPEAWLRMDDLRQLSPTWDVMVSRWSEMEKSFLDEVGFNWCKSRSAPKTYALMQEIRDSVYKEKR